MGFYRNRERILTIMSLLDRLTHDEEPQIGLHGFISSLREYARGFVTRVQIESAYSIDSANVQWNAILSMIDAQSTAQLKLLKVIEIGDVLILHEGVDSRVLYPTVTSIRNRFGL